MSALSDLQQHLAHYWQLPHHDDEALNQKLTEVQAWQRARIKRTHSELFNKPKNKLMAHRSKGSESRAFCACYCSRNREHGNISFHFSD